MHYYSVSTIRIIVGKIRNILCISQKVRIGDTIMVVVTFRPTYRDRYFDRDSHS